MKNGVFTADEMQVELQKPFGKEDMGWRIQSSGLKSDKKNVWAMAIPFIDARAVQKRLDHVFGCFGWTQEYKELSPGKYICKLSVLVGDRWITKEDGSDETKIEKFKGGLSGAFKRVAASGFGIGRYLYDCDTVLVNAKTDKPQYGAFKQDKCKYKVNYNDKDYKYKTFYWEVPPLPSINQTIEERENFKDKVEKEVYGDSTPNIEEKVIKPTIDKELSDKCIFDKAAPVNTTFECCDCHDPQVPNNVSSYSSNKLGKVLCLKCQQKYKK